MTTTATQQTHKVTKSQADLEGRSIRIIDGWDDAPASPTHRELQLDARAFLVQSWVGRLHQNAQFGLGEANADLNSNQSANSCPGWARWQPRGWTPFCQVPCPTISWRAAWSARQRTWDWSLIKWQIQWLRKKPVQRYLWNTHSHAPNLEIQGMSCPSQT